MADSVETVIYGYIRERIEQIYDRLIIPEGIKGIIASFVGFVAIESILLNNEEKLRLHSLLSAKWDSLFIDYKLLFRASRDGFDAITFRQYCGVPNTLSIVKVNQDGRINIFGGFTTQEWTAWNKQCADPNAFLFLLTSSAGYKAQIFDIKKGREEFAVCHLRNYLCFFGKQK